MRIIVVPTATIIVVAIFPSQDVLGDNLLIKPHIDAGIMEYEYRESTIYSQQFNTVQGKFHVNDLLPFAGGGVTVIYDRIFVDFYGQVTGEGTDNGSQEVIAPSQVYLPSFGAKLRYDSSIQNSGASVILGYTLIDNLSIFTGYRYSATEINWDNITLSRLDGFIPFSRTNSSLRLDFTYNGPLVGLSYAVPIEKLKGALQISTAGTYLSGNIEQRLKGPVSGSNKLSGNSVGYNVGISWTGRITDHLSYTLLADTSKYEFNGRGNNTPDFSESVYRLRAQLGYSFDMGLLFGLHNF